MCVYIYFAWLSFVLSICCIIRLFFFLLLSLIKSINHDNLHPINRTSHCQIISHPCSLPLSSTPLLRRSIFAHRTIGKQRFRNQFTYIPSISALRYTFLHVVIYAHRRCVEGVKASSIVIVMRQQQHLLYVPTSGMVHNHYIDDL